jgi:quercetin dioxygenase-like cupin family protein
VLVVLDGAGRLRSGTESFDLSRGTVVYIPRGATHEITALGGGLGYVYLTVWPKGKPAGVKPRIEKQGEIVNIYYD